MNKFRISCPHCRRKIDFLEDKLDQFIHCPACGLKVGLYASSAKPLSPNAGSARFKKGSLAGVALVAALLIGCVVLAVTQHHRATPGSGASVSGTNSLLTQEQLEKNAYMTNFVFTRLKFDRTDFGGTWGSTVSFGIKNNGDRAVTGLKITISFLDTNGTVCHQEPIVPFNDQTNAPMLPGQSWGNDPDNPYTIMGLPDSWQGGYDYAQVTDVQFLK
jgi:hypothetical protein